MRVFYYEWKKIKRKKMFWGIALILLLLNCGLFFYNQYYTEEYRAFGEFRGEYETFQKEIESIKPEKRKEHLEKLQSIYDMAGSIISLQYWTTNNEEDAEIYQMQLEQFQKEQPEIYEQAVKLVKDETVDVKAKYVTDYLEQMEYQEEYKDYITDMEKRTGNQLSNPVFKKGSYAYYNLLKTCMDFEACKDIKVEIGEHCGIEAGTGFWLTDFFVFAILFFLGIYMYVQEKEKGLLCLVRSNVKGRYASARAKCMVVLIITVFVCVFFYGVDLLLAHGLYGFGDTTRMVQSLPSFRNCSLTITIAQYLVVWFLLKIAVSLIFSLLVMCMLQLASNGKVVCMVMLILLGLEYLFKTYIPDRSIFSYWKYINLFSFSDGKRLLQTYMNLNFFGKPVNVYKIGIVLGIVSFALLVVGAIWLYPKQKHIEKKDGMLLADRLRKKFHRKRYCTQLWLFEWKKYFVQQKMLVLLLAVAGMAVMFYQGYQTDTYGDNKEAVYMSYMSKFEGAWDETKENYYQFQRAYFDGLKEELEALRAGGAAGEKEENYQRKSVITAILDTQQEGFYDVSNQYEHMQSMHKKYGMELEFPNEYAGRKLFYTKEDDVKNFVWMMAWVVLSIGSLFWAEYKKNLHQLIHGTPRGRKDLFRTKCIIGFGVGIFCYLAAYVPKLLSVYKQYGGKSLYCHLKVMPQFQCCGSDMTAVKALVCIMLTRLLLLLAAVALAIFLSVWCKNYLRSMILTAVILFVPCIFVSQIEVLRIVELVVHPYYWNVMIGIWIVLLCSIFFFIKKAKKLFCMTGR